MRVGNLVVLAQRDQEVLKQQKQSFLARGYRVSETHHFVVCQRAPSRQTLLIHPFGQAEIDADLICFIENELTAFNFVSTAKDFGATLFAVLASTFPAPRQQPTIWRHFCLNTLNKLRDQIDHPLPVVPSTVSYIAPFAAIYRRVFELFVGQSFLDVGCSFGFLPVLMAERAPGVCTIGCDNSADALGFSTDLAAANGAQHVMFTLQDVLAANILCLGTFDTVTAIHLLEHLQEAQLPLACEHLLKLTHHRLIIAVPYEPQAMRVYGHEQIFTQGKLEKWGKRCVELLGGTAQYWCEDLMGGLLIVDRFS